MIDLSYYENHRNEILQFITNRPKRVLELGCGAGNFSATLKEIYGCYVVGFEIFPSAAEQAKTKLDEVIVTSIDGYNFSHLGKFDLIIANDVLEHLIDPWAVIDRLYDNLSDTGSFIGSIPNIRQYKIITNLLLHGKWEYANEGILDRTHLRFFTKQSIIDAFRKYEIVELTCLSKLRTLSKRIQYKLWPDLLTNQYCVVASRRQSKFA
ncbi:class I SAM-dependent methyltransferase [Pelosinus propionicus]|uniref:Methyltransferase domain-containing protein n=1 Tax=Pelosinus propionicus DSM 13327 TaxID=1123291 RepID=A0A1I4MPN0_9FIRM|nr:class I SAM-dependent methyltransferase [Pelosinus propionicus]SFM05302.1 Methyltransferase domain-containing protein [Pelosinus propionicus DSM 13327]